MTSLKGMNGMASSFVAGYVAWGVGYVAFVVGGLGEKIEAIGNGLIR